MRSKVSPWLSIVALLFLFMLSQVLGSTFAMAFDLLQDTSDAPSASLAAQTPPRLLSLGMIAADVLLAVVLWVFAFVRRGILRRLTPPVPRGSLTALAAFLLLALGLGLFTDSLQLDDGGAIELLIQMSMTVPGLLLLCLIGPLAEELVFREGLLRQLGRAGVHHFPAALFSSLLFGLAHFNWAQLVPSLLLGIVLAYLYYMTGDVRLSFAAHVLNNTMAVVSLRFPAFDEAFMELGSVPFYAVTLLLIFVGLLAFYAVLRKYRPLFISAFGKDEE